MKNQRPTAPCTLESIGDRRDRWWSADRFAQPEKNKRGARRFHARRRQVLPVEMNLSPTWWPMVRYLVIVAALLAPIVTLRYGATVKSQMAEWQASRQTARILASLENQPNPAAIDQLVPVLQKHPSQPALIRKLAWLASDQHPHQAITLFYRLHDLDSASFDDQLQLGRLLVKTDRHALGQEIFGRLMQEQPSAHEPWIECGHAALAVGDPLKAETAYQQALMLQPASADCLIALAQMLQTQSPPETGSRATDALLSLASGHLESGNTAEFSKITTALTTLPRLSPAQKVRFLKLTTNPAICPIEVQLARPCMEAPDQLSTEDREKLTSLWSRHLAKADSASRSRGLRWLQNLGEHDFVIAVTDRPSLYEDGSELTLRLLSLLGTHRNDLASRLVAHPKAGFSRLHPQILAAFDAFRTQPQQTLGLVLKRLFQDSEPALQSAEACYVIGMLALNTGTPDLALSALTRAVELIPSWTLPAEPLLVAARKSGQGIDQVLEGLRNISHLPASNALRKRLAYLKLLACQDLAATAAEIQSLHAAFPGDPFVRLLAAFGRYKKRDFAAAVKDLLPLPNYKWHQGEAAVIVSIMASGGLLDQTQPLVKVIKPSHLFPEEKELVTPWLDRLVVNASPNVRAFTRLN